MRRAIIMKLRKNAVTNSLEKQDSEAAYFHEWGIGVYNEGSAMANKTMAIMEKDDGSVVLVEPEMVRFLDSPVK